MVKHSFWVVKAEICAYLVALWNGVEFLSKCRIRQHFFCFLFCDFHIISWCEHKAHD